MRRNIVRLTRYISAFINATYDKRVADTISAPILESDTIRPVINKSLPKRTAFWSSLAASCAAVTVSTLALCEAHSRTRENNASTDDNLYDESNVRRAIYDLWARLDERLHRLDAAKTPHPHSATSPSPLPHTLPQPEVEFNFQNQVSVKFYIPQNLNVKGSTAFVRSILNRPSSNISGPSMAFSTSETSSSGPKGVARRFRRSSPINGEAFIVDIVEPYDANEPAIFEFKGNSSSENLRMVEAIMQHVVMMPQNTPHTSQSDDGHRYYMDFPPSHLFNNRELEDGLQEFFGPLRDLVEEFERMHRFGMEQHQYRPPILSDRGDSDSGSHPRSNTRPKRFDTEQFEDSNDIDSIYNTNYTKNTVNKLRDMGCQVFLPSTGATTPPLSTSSSSPPLPTGSGVAAKVDWGQLAGYDDQKRMIEDSLLLPLLRPDVYDSVAKGTREKFAPNRPRAILFVGPPGTGKTSSARVIASQAAVPLVYVPLEALVSKWYGESEKKLATALELADQLPTGCIVFLDELDSLATTRSGEMHEATRRLLGVLLRHMDGFDSSKKSCVVGATNRPGDLDPALLSRFSATIEFGLPEETCRAEILKQYAHHLKETELRALAAATPGCAGRDLRDICEQAERRWAANIIRGKASEGELPPLKLYLEAANARREDVAKSRSSKFAVGLAQNPFTFKVNP